MQGYIKDTLSTALVSHPAVRKDFLPNQMHTDTGLNVTQCRSEDITLTQLKHKRSQRSGYLDNSCCVYSYRDYRSNEDYTLTSQFWLVMAMRFAFVILFEVRIQSFCQKTHLS